MSIKVMTMVWDGFPAAGSELLAMLAMADWSNIASQSSHGQVKYAHCKKIAVGCGSPVKARGMSRNTARDAAFSIPATSFGSSDGMASAMPGTLRVPPVFHTHSSCRPMWKWNGSCHQAQLEHSMSSSLDASRQSDSVPEFPIRDLVIPQDRPAPRKRKSITKKTRFEVFKRDSFKCQYCGASAPEAVLVVDHIDPFSKGGADEITNYITACQPCNSGKSDRTLDDNTAIQKQKAQLDELNERRNQLEMMMAWRNSLKAMDDEQIAVLRDAWDEGAPGWSLSDTGEKELRALFKKYGMPAVLDAIEKSVSQYVKKGEGGKATAESVSTAWQKLGGILRLSSMPDDQRALYYVKGILRNRISYVPDNIVTRLQQALAAGVEVDDMKEAAKSVRNWTQFRTWLEESEGSQA